MKIKATINGKEQAFSSESEFIQEVMKHVTDNGNSFSVSYERISEDSCGDTCSCKEEPAPTAMDKFEDNLLNINELTLDKVSRAWAKSKEYTRTAADLIDTETADKLVGDIISKINKEMVEVDEKIYAMEKEYMDRVKPLEDRYDVLEEYRAYLNSLVDRIFQKNREKKTGAKTEKATVDHFWSWWL